MGVQLNVIVVGGGICGLATALGLKRSGHNVTIYERYKVDTEQGAGLVIGPNAHLVMKQWGLDPKANGMLRFLKALVVDGKTLDVIADRKVHKEAEIAGEYRVMTTRQDLRQMIRSEAFKPPSDGEGSVEIVYDSKVLDYNPVEPAVQFIGGTWKTADLVVACDGINSKAATHVSGRINRAIPTGQSAFRLAIPAEQLSRSELVRKHTNSEADLETTWFCTDQEKRVLVWWRCHFGETHALDICIPDNEEWASSEEWLAKCDKLVLLNEFKDWHPLFHEILQLADRPSLWKICAREPLDKIYQGKLVLLGDGLHPMQPYKGQGASQAIEDAGVLEICLKDMKSKEELPARLKVLESLRVPRVSIAQLASNLRFDTEHENEDWENLLRRAKGYLDESEHARLVTKRDLDIWLIKYNAREEARKALQRDIEERAETATEVQERSPASTYGYTNGEP